jgi:hypothetical protein
VALPNFTLGCFFFDQPFGGVLARKGYKRTVDRMRAHTAWAYHEVAEAVGLDSPDVRPPDWRDDEAPPWVSEVRKLLGVKSDGIWVTRANPDWKYYTADKNAFSIAELTPNAALRLRFAFGWYDPVAIERGGRHILKAANLFNSVPSALLHRGVQILRCVEQDSALPWAGLSAKPSDVAIIAIPIESHCVFLGRSTIVVLRAACGYKEYLAARDDWARQSKIEAEIFNCSTECIWAERPDPQRFEELAGALLESEPGFSWVRSAGSTLDRGQGRDLVAQWLTPPGIGLPVKEKETERPFCSRTVGDPSKN